MTSLVLAMVVSTAFGGNGHPASHGARDHAQVRPVTKPGSVPLVVTGSSSGLSTRGAERWRLTAAPTTDPDFTVVPVDTRRLPPG